VSIPFTQYLLPNGRRASIEIDMDSETEQKAQALIAQGCHFDAEILRTGIVSFTCEKDDLDDPCLAIELSPNGPEVVVAVKKLVDDAYKMNV